VDAVNLVNQHGSELVLSRAFEEQAAAFAKGGRGFRLITFDFHKQCGGTSYHKCVRRSAFDVQRAVVATMGR